MSDRANYNDWIQKQIGNHSGDGHGWQGHANPVRIAASAGIDLPIYTAPGLIPGQTTIHGADGDNRGLWINKWGNVVPAFELLSYTVDNKRYYQAPTFEYTEYVDVVTCTTTNHTKIIDSGVVALDTTNTHTTYSNYYGTPVVEQVVTDITCVASLYVPVNKARLVTDWNLKDSYNTFTNPLKQYISGTDSFYEWVELTNMAVQNWINVSSDTDTLDVGWSDDPSSPDATYHYETIDIISSGTVQLGKNTRVEEFGNSSAYYDWPIFSTPDDPHTYFLHRTLTVENFGVIVEGDFPGGSARDYGLDSDEVFNEVVVYVTHQYTQSTYIYQPGQNPAHAVVTSSTIHGPYLFYINEQTFNIDWRADAEFTQGEIKIYDYGNCVTFSWVLNYVENGTQYLSGAHVFTKNAEGVYEMISRTHDMDGVGEYTRTVFKVVENGQEMTYYGPYNSKLVLISEQGDYDATI